MAEGYLFASVLDQAALVAGKLQASPFITVALGGAAYYAVSNSTQAIGVAKANASWNVISTVLGAAVGALYFGEALTTRNYVGIAFALYGIYLLNGDL